MKKPRKKKSVRQIPLEKELRDEAMILNAASAISDRRTFHSRNMARLARMLNRAANRIMELTPSREEKP